MRQFHNILSSYDPDVDFDALEKLKHPGLKRWNKGVELWQSGLPTQDAALINPSDSDEAILADVKEFTRRWKSSGVAEVMNIRIDSLNPKNIPPPSNAEKKYDDFSIVLKKVRESAAAGFIPSLWALSEERGFALTSACIMFETSERVSLEMLGPGHDPSDMAKGTVRPPIIITMKPFAPPLLEFKGNLSHLPFYLDIRDEAKDLATNPEKLDRIRAERREARINFLAHVTKISPEEQIKKMKREGNTLLFEREKKLSFTDIEKLFGFAIQYAEYKQTHRLPFLGDTLAAAQSSSGKYAFNNAWDKNKFGDK